jgi:hypothetical protein
MFRTAIARVSWVLLLSGAAPPTLPAAMDIPCSPFLTYTRAVGDMASDDTCTDNDIAAAIQNTVCPNTTIYVIAQHGSSTYAAQHLLIQDKALSIVGSSASTCNVAIGNNGAANSRAAIPTAPVITISGSGHTGSSVISIQDSNVTLKYLEISGGQSNFDQYGGGIYFGGTGALTLDTDTVDNNYAGYGGGINMTGSGGDATLTLKHYTQVLNNSAQFNGGGIRLDGAARLVMLEDISTIAFNHALGFTNPLTHQISGGYGGGIVVYGPATADIASPGAIFAGAISDNEARYGGGVAIVSTSGGEATTRLFSVDATRPVVVSQNRASVEGGAFYVKPSVDGAGGATLCAQDFRIDANRGPEGAAIYTDYDSAFSQFAALAQVFLNSAGDCGQTPTLASLGAVACAAGTACSEISDNSALTPQGQPSAGSILYFDNFSALALNRFVMRGNDAAQLVTALFENSGSTSSLSNCLIVDNHSIHELVHEESDNLRLDNCTFANNTIDNGYVFFAKHGFTLTRTIVDQPGRSTIDYLPDGCDGCFEAQYVVATETDTFPANFVTVFQSDDPMFVDATNANIDKRNYHLRAYRQNGIATASPAIDFAPPVAGDDRDLANSPHDQDVAAIADQFGVRDLGAYEAQPILDRVFGDGLGDPISLVF